VGIRRLIAVTGAVAIISGAAVGLNAAAAYADIPGWNCGSEIATSTTHGQLCIQYVAAGYNVAYQKDGGVYQNAADFNLYCPPDTQHPKGETFGDRGAFPIYPGQTKTYVFAVGSRQVCEVILYDRTNGGKWIGPSIDR
jgi:hypothetical protein